MSLLIEIDDVYEVLLADGWHKVYKNSFSLDSYEYVNGMNTRKDKYNVIHGGGNSGVCATGFTFAEKIGAYFQTIFGSLLDIKAVKYKPELA